MAVSRSAAYINQDIILQAEFRQPVTLALFDPAAVEQVEIIDTDGVTVLQTFAAGAITRVSQGLYQVIGAAACYDTPGLYFDRWTARIDPGDVPSQYTLQTVVAAMPTAVQPFTRQWFIDTYLTGIDLTDERGQPYAESVFDHAIAAAVERTRKELDIEIALGTFEERHDFDWRQWGEWCWLQVRKRPLQSIDELIFQFGQTPVLRVPLSWIVQTVPESGQFQMVPSGGSTTALGPAPGYGIPPWIGPGAGYGARTVPAFYRVTYKAGFATGQFPEDVKQIIGLHAAMFVLATAGELVAGPGVAAKSISMDGLMQNLTSTASATMGGYGARITQCWKELKALLPLVRAYYHGFPMRVA